jgi:hypothetical protein
MNRIKMKSLFVVFLIVNLFSTGKTFSQNKMAPADTGRIYLTANSIPVPEKKSLVLGASIGSPASASLVGGIYYNDFSLKLSGMAWSSSWYGIEGSISFAITRNENLIQSISFVGGRYSAKIKKVNMETNSEYDEIRKEKYFGLAYDINYDGFYLQTGLGIGSGDYGNPILLFQTGYLFNINF